MCGIAGRVNQHGPIDRAELYRMIETIAHRGPDDCGYHLRDRVGLGHRRLSIVDVAGGRQPLTNEDGTVWIVYNGEIYNHLDLRHDLIERGHSFSTHSDTEVIVHAYEEWGADCVSRLRGMFAFAVWDERAHCLTLVRDRLGIKPLYYARIGADLIFGSELKSVMSVPGVDRAIDEEALSTYLDLRYVPAPLTLCRGVRKLEPGTILTWHDGLLSRRSYWDLTAVATRDPRPPTAAEAALELRDRIDETTAMHLLGEVPIGTFLSGGIDSTMVTASMRHASPGRLRSFAVGYSDDHTASEDELGWSRLAADWLGTEHHEVRIDAKEVRDALETIAWHLDEPVADPACVPLWFLARRAREQVTVVLSGEGADEAFAGYGIYAKMALASRLQRSGGRAVALLAALGATLPSERVRRLARMSGLPIECAYRGVSQGIAPHLRERLWRGAPESTATLLEPHWQASAGHTPLRRMLYLDTRVWLPDDLLIKADRMTMAHGLELRVPFLDHELLEHAWSLPDHFKLDRQVGKAALRRAARGRVPPSVLTRPKKGFGTPTATWLRGGLFDYACDLLRARDSFARTHFERAPIDQLLVRHRRGDDCSSDLWTLLSLESWHRAFRKQVSATAPTEEPGYAAVGS